MEFKCDSCNLLFEAEGTTIERIDPVFGPTSTTKAQCPQCDATCGVHVKPKPGKQNAAPPMPASCQGCQNRSCGM